MKIILMSVLTSFLVSVFIGNVVGIHYLKKLDRDWEKTFDEMKKIMLEEIKKAR